MKNADAEKLLAKIYGPLTMAAGCEEDPLRVKTFLEAELLIIEGCRIAFLVNGVLYTEYSPDVAGAVDVGLSFDDDKLRAARRILEDAGLCEHESLTFCEGVINDLTARFERTAETIPGVHVKQKETALPFPQSLKGSSQKGGVRYG
ncbi:hypothetical protein [Acetonema longum]|uniref:Uncharacterized protein n=1 Tax=Acetonema longum DSM 6540 TaxID=1009370 RepID=F7NEI3_9FIRM|nr:hypothetical protein [Acetonema longum]EGO65394.1 hypothetical protein ALO_02231 [Acetonema longum DSM 6540]